VSLFGGVGTVLGAMIGAVLIAAVSNGMNVINVQSYWQSLVIGVIILLGVTFDTYRRSSSARLVRRRAPPAAGAALSASRNRVKPGNSA
jgi:ribose transport system permease protein